MKTNATCTVCKSKGMTNKARGEETRRRLIEVGLQLFAMNGFNGVSMRNLASEAEVNLATVGYHFGGKQGLYEAILNEIIACRDEVMPGMDVVMEKVSEYESGTLSGEEAVAWFFRSFMSGMLSNPASIWGIMLINRELAAPSEAYSMLDEKFFSPSIDAMNMLLKAVMPDGTTFTEIMIVGTALIGIALKFVNHKAFSDRVGWDEMTPERIDIITETLCKRAVAFVCCNEA
ncbi:CerR family C-terminal domain-containing protein [Maridesulfovibrio sp.]|uniref:CerR family C-terminal domain-containing protein n=1 Tax=Maridesulfovibrio sp. TaxID=2795000 RepID=UPI002A186FF0|nr:CerR family C-terminal domain-containing protein [Maridesulfovibrio sp.]